MDIQPGVSARLSRIVPVGHDGYCAPTWQQETIAKKRDVVSSQIKQNYDTYDVL